MEILRDILIGLVALMQFGFMWLAMFGWERHGSKVFNLLPGHLFGPAKNMAAYQGLHHGLLGAGLLWSFAIAKEEWSSNVALFFLGCILLSAVFGSMTISKKMLLLHGLPAALALVVTFLVRFG